MSNKKIITDEMPMEDYQDEVLTPSIEYVTLDTTVTVAEAKKTFEQIKREKIAEETARLVKVAKKNSMVLNAYRVEKVGNDSSVWERIVMPDNYAGQAGVKEFVAPNGRITYYVEKLVKKYSDNVVKETK